MNKSEFIREVCLSMKGATEDMPFDETTLCFRVGGKIFAITDIEDKPVEVNLKCEPEKAIELREKYDYIKPGWHMNKKHWNTVTIDEHSDYELIVNLVKDSYNLIFDKLPKKEKIKIS
jgi:predicted DNA-binding protein (MmcQ/YjbR family)